MRCEGPNAFKEMRGEPYGPEDFVFRGFIVGRNHFIVAFKPDANWCDIKRAIASVGGRIRDYIRTIGWAIVDVPCVDFEGLDAAMEDLRANPHVGGVAHDVQFGETNADCGW